MGKTEARVPPDGLYRTIVEQSPQSTMVFRPDGTPVSANRAYQEMWGINDQMLRVILEEYNILEDPALERQGVSEYIRRGFAGEVVVVPVIRYEPERGSTSDIGVRQRWVRGFLYPLRDSANEIMEIVLVHQDITDKITSDKDQRDLREQLNTAQKIQAVAQLAGGAAHDFNNSLAVISCQTELAIARPELRDEALAVIRDTVISAARLTRSLMELGRGGVTAEPQPIELGQWLRQTIEILDSLVGSNVSLSLAANQAEMWVMADPDQLQQVALNLCLNARDAMPNGGAIQVAVELAEQGVEVTFADDGCGIPESLIDRVFEPLFTTKEQGKGTGLGLSMVNSVITQHDGTVRVTSVEGQGTTFHIRLPLIAPPSTAFDRKPEKVGGKGELVLVVDDHSGVRKGVARLLRVAGYRVISVQNGEEALLVFDQHDDVALVVSDVVMAGMSGPSLIRALRLRRPGQPALFVSGFTGASHQEEVRALSCEWMSKPFNSAALLSRVHSLTAPKPEESESQFSNQSTNRA